MAEKHSSSSSKAGYFGSILSSAKTVLEGMAVTATYLFRKQVTVQYPDRTSVPVVDSLPERYRGFLEVDMDICTACKACERDCPIDCIEIDIEKVDGVRVMTRFDIDLGKCMYCGICVESCPTDAKAPGDEEGTKCIRFTREFEAATTSFPTLTFRFIRPGDYVVPYKPTKGEIVDTWRRGDIARQVRQKAREFNTIAIKWGLEHGIGGAKDSGIEQIIAEEVVVKRAEELAPMVAEAGDDVKKFEDLLYNQALAQTDCEACGWPTCREYADAMLKGKDAELFKCEPGGAQATRDTVLIISIRKGKSPADAAKTSIEAVKQHHAA
jgi:formate hydrogenlyase subunit 6/NADH:ubiquinone oxidoreductase subunit I